MTRKLSKALPESDVKLTKIIDSGINEWEFKYDIMGNAIEMIYPDGSKIKQGYDIIGRLTSFTNKRNQEITYQYDPDDHLRIKTTPEGDTEFTYDYKDRLTEVTAPDYHYQYQYGTPGGIYGWTLVQVDDLEGENTRWSTQSIYNRYGFPIDFYDSFRWHKVYSYNPVSGGDPTTFSPASISYYKTGSSAALQLNNYYDQGNRLFRKRNEYLRIMTEYSFDTNGILETINYKNLPGNFNFPEIDLDFARDNSGLIDTITGFTNQTKDKEWHVDYNSDLEITGVQRTLPFQFDESYTYDTRGNRLTSTITGTTGQSYTYNNLNQLTSTSTHNYSYDADGNLTEETDIATGEKKKYFFNSENRMYRYEHYPSSTSPADIVATYKYDLYGRRIHKTVNGTATNFFWEGDNMAMELDGNLNPIRRYIYGAGKDEAEGYIEFSDLDPGDFVFESTEKGWYSFTKDQVGSIFQVYSHYNEGGVTEGVADIRDYDTFGNLVNGTTISAGNLGFQSKYYDQESGLYYFYNRYYHPVNGRFLNEDPIGLEGGLNMYGFIGNDPMNSIDPYGLRFKSKRIHRDGPWHPPDGMGFKCDWNDDCKKLRWKMYIFGRIIRSHMKWDGIMPKPRGGNRHAKDLIGFWHGYARCQGIYLAKNCDKEWFCDKKLKKFAEGGFLVLSAIVVWKIGKMIAGGLIFGPPGVLAGGIL
jgi:RHS repeat-associated protein